MLIGNNGGEEFHCVNEKKSKLLQLNRQLQLDSVLGWIE